MKKTLFALLIVIAFGSCSESKPKEKKTRDEMWTDLYPIGSYLYLENGKVLHVSKTCVNLDRDENDNRLIGVKRVRSEKVTYQMLDNCCPNCVTDINYEKLSRMAKYNVKDSL